MSQITDDGSIIPSNPKDQEAILDAIKEADEALTKAEIQKDAVAAIVDEIHEKYEINKGIIRKMIRTYHKQNFNKVEQESEDFITAYETIVKG